MSARARAEQAEQLKRRHIEAEGRHAWNDNPDGCYYCGSPHHHSSDCQDRAAFDECVRAYMEPS